MNKPEYIIVDEFGLIANEIEAVLLALPVPPISSLNYQYGYIRELNETLQQWSKTETDRVLKFPLLYLEQPFNVQRSTSAATYGKLDVVRVFIINETQLNWKAKDRMDNNFKPIIYPIYRELLNQIDLSQAFSTQSADQIEHTFTDRYFWGNDQQNVLNDKIDCSIVTFRNLTVNNNPNCLPATSMLP